MKRYKNYYYFIYYLLCFFTLVAHAETTEIKTERDIYPLAAFMPQSEPIKIKNAGSSYSVFLPVSHRTSLESVVLRLQVTNSISLVKDRSQLVVLLNQHTVAQFQLDPYRPETLVDINLPIEYFKTGYNQLEFRAAQHYAAKCEEPTAPELWTEINTTNSYLKIKSKLKTLTPKLSELNDLFDPKLTTSQYRLNIMTAQAKKPLDDLHLKWGGLAAQATALRLQYIAPIFRYQNITEKELGIFAQKDQIADGVLLPSSPKEADTILMGTKAELTTILPKAILEQIQASYIGIYPLLPDKKRFVLVVSGQAPQDVTRALEVLNFASLPLPDTPFTIIKEADLPRFGAHAGKKQVYENNYYRFSQLEYKTTSQQGLSPSPVSIDFNVSADLFTHDEMTFEIDLHFAYASGMRRDSMLGILVNGQFQSSISLNNEQGASVTKYKVSLPFSALKPGKNQITFEAKLRPMVTGECQNLFTDSLQLTIYDDSVIKMPYANHFAVLPDLNLFARTGFPYTVNGTGATTYLYVASHEDESIAAAWTLMAKIAQRKMLPLYEATISHRPPNVQENQRDLLIIGTVNKIDASIQKTAPFYVSDQFNRIAHVVESSGQSEAERNLDLLDRIINEVHKFTGWGESKKSEHVELMRVVQGHTLGSTGLALQYQSPYSKDHTVTLFTATSPETLAERVSQLVQPEFWDNLKGDVVVWFDRNKTNTALPLYSQITGSRYFLGDIGITSMAEYYFSRSPLVWVGIIVVITIVLAVVSYKLLNRFRRRHHGQVKDKK